MNPARQRGRAAPPLDTDVFIVRAWREPREVAGAPAEWRFAVEHVRSGTRRSFTRLDRVTAFIATHVRDAGASAPWWRRILRPR
jgi:hypothetical protein